jgi:predicted transcriptional regulator
MSVAPTSLIAFKELVESGKEKTQLAKVFKAILGNPGCSRRDLATITGFEMSSITGRVNKLLQLKFVEEKSIKTSSTGKKVKCIQIAKLQTVNI